MQITLARPAKIGTVIINFADPEGYAVDFKCLAVVDGKEREILQVNVLV